MWDHYSIRQIEYYFEVCERESVEETVKQIRLHGGEVEDPEWVQAAQRELRRLQQAAYDTQEAEWMEKIRAGHKLESIDLSKGSFYAPPKPGTRIG